MNLDRRVLSALLIGSGLLVIIGMIGALPFRNQSNNQLNSDPNNQLNQNQTQDQAFAQTPPDRLPITDFNASRTGVAELNPGTGTGTGEFDTPGTNPGSNDLAQDSGNGTGSGLPPGASTRPAAPALPAAW